MSFFQIQIMNSKDNKHKVDFKYFISLALENELSWECVTNILDESTSNLALSKQLNRILIQELKESESKRCKNPNEHTQISSNINDQDTSIIDTAKDLSEVHYEEIGSSTQIPSNVNAQETSDIDPTNDSSEMHYEEIESSFEHPKNDIQEINNVKQKNNESQQEYNSRVHQSGTKENNMEEKQKIKTGLEVSESDNIDEMKHVQLVHREKNFQCAQCSRLFSLKSVLISHLEVCSNNTNMPKNKRQKPTQLRGIDYNVVEYDFSCKTYKCKICELQSSNSKKIMQHIYHVHRERKFKCEKCDRLFPFDSNLRQHKKYCDGSKKPTQRSDVRHKMRDVEYSVIENDNLGKMYQCKRCEKSFNSLHMIYQHILNIHKEKKFRCEHCDKLFSSNSLFNYHKKMYHGQHKGLKSKCEVCDGVYKNPYVLKVHFNQSHRERKFKCEKCNEMFPFKSSLEKHIEKCDSETIQESSNFKEEVSGQRIVALKSKQESKLKIVGLKKEQRRKN